MKNKENEFILAVESVQDLPNLSASDLERLNLLAQQSDEEIDCSEIPVWTTEMFETGIRNPFYKAKKQQLTIRLDSDVLHWLKSQGKGYQSRINEILRQAMLASMSK